MSDHKGNLQIQIQAGIFAFVVLLAMLVTTSSRVVGLSDRLKKTEKTLYRIERELIQKQVIDDPVQCCN